MLIKYMDMYLGIPSVIMDTDVDRRKYYGNAGSFRFTDYGVEYRVLSGYFLKDEETLRWVHRQTVKAVQAMVSGAPLISEKDAQEIINSTDSASAIARAKKLIKKFNIE